MPRSMLCAILAGLTSAALVGCGSDSTSLQNSAPLAPGDLAASAKAGLPALPPSGDFVSEIDNPYLAFERGRVFRYAGETDEGVETIVVEVTGETKSILGVATTVVHDQAFLDGELIEDTIDWYAQDKDGNVWYFGEDSKEIQDGEVIGTEGSWLAGVDGAVPGIIMLAEPELGIGYRQELAEGVAEDEARVVSLSKTVTVPHGTFGNCLQTVEWTPLSPGAREFKFYAPGIGQVLEIAPAKGRSRVELIAVE